LLWGTISECTQCGARQGKAFPGGVGGDTKVIENYPRLPFGVTPDVDVVWLDVSVDSPRSVHIPQGIQ
jgi:hypothetical protein